MTANLEGAVWRKSSRSGNSGGQCVEVACFGGVRDSKNQDGPVLAFGHTELTEFLAAAKSGRFDR